MFKNPVPVAPTSPSARTHTAYLDEHMERPSVPAVGLWCSYVGDGAPSNAAGARTGLGTTQEEAHAAAGHWANQAAYARCRRIVLADRALPVFEDAVARRYFTNALSNPEPTPSEIEAARILKANDWAGGWASAWRALHAPVVVPRWDESATFPDIAATHDPDGTPRYLTYPSRKPRPSPLPGQGFAALKELHHVDDSYPRRDPRAAC